MFDSFVFLPLSTRAYFKGRAYIKIILKNHARSYFAGRSYYRGNTVSNHSKNSKCQEIMQIDFGLLVDSTAFNYSFKKIVVAENFCGTLVCGSI